MLVNPRMYIECNKAEHEDTAYDYSHHGITKCTNFHHSRAIFINKTARNVAYGIIYVSVHILRINFVGLSFSLSFFTKDKI